MKSKELISKTNGAMKSLLRVSAALMQSSYDMHFEEDISVSIADLSRAASDLAEKLQELKVSYSKFADDKSSE
jgi:hypothetical protein